MMMNESYQSGRMLMSSGCAALAQDVAAGEFQEMRAVPQHRRRRHQQGRADPQRARGTPGRFDRDLQLFGGQ